MVTYLRLVEQQRCHLRHSHIRAFPQHTDAKRERKDRWEKKESSPSSSFFFLFLKKKQEPRTNRSNKHVGDEEKKKPEAKKKQAVLRIGSSNRSRICGGSIRQASWSRASQVAEVALRFRAALRDVIPRCQLASPRFDSLTDWLPTRKVMVRWEKRRF